MVERLDKVQLILGLIAISTLFSLKPMFLHGLFLVNREDAKTRRLHKEERKEKSPEHE
jgi:hypothetical protein